MRDNNGQCELLVVMPVYNEEASLRKVVREWCEELHHWTSDFVLLVINDGSTDKSHEVLNALANEYAGKIEVINQDNSGHGQSCLKGYRIACERGVPYCFQIDSDGQCDPQYFYRLWRQRDNFDVIYGWRRKRQDGLMRRFASVILRLTLLVQTGADCKDANSPYRLMKTKSMRAHLAGIPREFFLCNVALAVLVQRNKQCKVHHVPITFRERYGGEPSVRLSLFGGKAVELVSQLKRLKDQ